MSAGADILRLVPAETGPAVVEPQPSVIALLEALLIEARAGKVQAVAVAMVRGLDRAGQAWELGTGPTGHILHAAVTSLFTRFSMVRVELGAEVIKEEDNGEDDAG